MVKNYYLKDPFWCYNLHNIFEIIAHYDTLFIAMPMQLLFTLKKYHSVNALFKKFEIKKKVELNQDKII